MAADTQEHTVVLQVVPGEVLGERWRVERRLGQGAMGSVFKGTDLQTFGPVAVKILAPEHCRKAKVLARFEREAEKMTTLRHPNIVRLLGHGRRGALPYIAMEYLDGMTLSEVLTHEGGTLPLPETVALIAQLARGLEFLHGNELVHRDVKPQNVIVGADGHVTLLDLGVVRDQARPGLTRPGAMVGTPYYMSPEQILGAEDIDRRTDVYALAAVTFELLTGRPPFLGDNNFEVLYGHKNLPPPDASEVAAGVSKAVGRVLMRALSKRREERPRTVTEFAEALGAASGHAAVDLSTRFAFVVRGRSPAADAITNEKTRILRTRPAPVTRDAPPPPVADTAESSAEAPSGEVPMADQADVVSVPGVPVVGESLSNLETVVVHLDGLTGPRRTTAEQPSTGQLRVIVTARRKAVSATLHVDGVRHDVTPRTLTLNPGTHRVRVEYAGHRAVEREVVVEPGDSRNLRIRLEPL